MIHIICIIGYQCQKSKGVLVEDEILTLDYVIDKRGHKILLKFIEKSFVIGKFQCGIERNRINVTVVYMDQIKAGIAKIVIPPNSTVFEINFLSLSVTKREA